MQELFESSAITYDGQLPQTALQIPSKLSSIEFLLYNYRIYDASCRHVQITVHFQLELFRSPISKYFNVYFCYTLNTCSAYYTKNIIANT